ncbi:Natural resistance-associated macrophage protein 1, partial [Frankliniella fusca]
VRRPACTPHPGGLEGRGDEQRTHALTLVVRPASLRRVWRISGPGALISTAYMNSGSIEANVESGSGAQFQLLWLNLLTALLSVLLQRLALRLGAASRRDLAEHCTTFYCRAPRYFKWALMEMAILSSDMQNVIGTAVALHIISRAYVPLSAGVALSLLDTCALLLMDRAGPRTLQLLFAFFVIMIASTFGYEYFKVLPDQASVLKGIVVPACEECSKNVYILVVSLIGSGLTPHNLFLHSGLVKEIVDREGFEAVQISGVNFALLMEVCVAVLVSYVFNVFITSAIGATVYGQTNSQLREECLSGGSPFADVFPNDNETATADIYTGGVFLGCRHGSMALTMWSLGVLTAALAGTLHSSRAGRFIMEGFLRIQWSHWRRAVVVRVLSATPMLFVALFADVTTLVLVNSVLNLVLSLHLPAAAIPAIALTANRGVMGEHVSSKFSTASSLLLTSGVVATNVYLGVRLAYDWLPTSWGYILGAVLLGLGYLSHIVYLLLDMASSCGASDRLSACRFGQRYLNQPTSCPR